MLIWVSQIEERTSMSTPCAYLGKQTRHVEKGISAEVASKFALCCGRAYGLKPVRLSLLRCAV
jgi:hypothetical protein